MKRIVVILGIIGIVITISILTILIASVISSRYIEAFSFAMSMIVSVELSTLFRILSQSKGNHRNNRFHHFINKYSLVGVAVVDETKS
ncbi:MAG: hypothetical protein ACYDAO_03950 [Thermoplasmataceae archaeon]